MLADNRFMIKLYHAGVHGKKEDKGAPRILYTYQYVSIGWGVMEFNEEDVEIFERGNNTHLIRSSEQMVSCREWVALCY
jgi:hypothetical protein